MTWCAKSSGRSRPRPAKHRPPGISQGRRGGRDGGVTPDTIREWISRGILPPVEGRARAPVRRDELEAYLAEPRHERARGAVASELTPEELANLDSGRRRGR